MSPTGPRELAAQRRLVELEGTIQGGLDSFIAVGQALLEIRDSRLYRFVHASFEDYAKVRWGISRQRSYQLMDAAAVSTVVDTTNEGQARELAPVLRDEGREAVREVWTETVARTNGKPTAVAVREVVRERVRGLAAVAEAELKEATGHWTPEQRAAVAPEVMRQRGELIRLIRDLAALPEPVALAHAHAAYLPADFLAETAAATGWLEFFCDALEGKR